MNINKLFERWKRLHNKVDNLRFTDSDMILFSNFVLRSIDFEKTKANSGKRLKRKKRKENKTVPIEVMVELTKIVDLVCELTNTSIEKVLSRTRKDNVVDTRRKAFYFMRKYTNYSLKYIGLVLNRDHSTVLYSTNKHQNYCDTDQIYKENSDYIDYEISKHFKNQLANKK